MPFQILHDSEKGVMSCIWKIKTWKSSNLAWKYKVKVLKLWVHWRDLLLRQGIDILQELWKYVAEAEMYFHLAFLMNHLVWFLQYHLYANMQILPSLLAGFQINIRNQLYTRIHHLQLLLKVLKGILEDLKIKID